MFFFLRLKAPDYLRTIFRLVLVCANKDNITSVRIKRWLMLSQGYAVINHAIRQSMRRPGWRQQSSYTRQILSPGSVVSVPAAILPLLSNEVGQ